MSLITYSPVRVPGSSRIPPPNPGSVISTVMLFSPLCVGLLIEWLSSKGVSMVLRVVKHLQHSRTRANKLNLNLERALTGYSEPGQQD